MGVLRKPRYGVLIISHGSRNKEWVRLVDDAVDSVTCEYPILSVFLEFEPDRDLITGVQRLKEKQVEAIIAVPLFVSSGSGHVGEIGEMLRELEQSKNIPIHYTSPLDDEPEVAQLLYDKLRQKSQNPSHEIVLLVGHGSKDQEAQREWHENLASLSRQLQALGGFFAVDAALLLPDQAADRLAWWNRKHPNMDVFVLPVFLSRGYFTDTVIPQRLEGLKYLYCNEALLPSPYISRVLESKIALYKNTYTNTYEVE